MAGDSKTEKATPKKRTDERKKGNLLTSKDIITIVTMMGTFYTLQYMFPSMIQNIEGFFARIFALASSKAEASSALVSDVGKDLIYTAGAVVLPIALVAMSLGIIASIIQTKPIIVWDALKPKFSGMNPLQGIKRLFSMKSAFDVIKNLLKVSILGSILYKFISGLVLTFSKTIQMELTASAVLLLSEIMGLVFQVSIAFLAIAVADYFFQWWEYERKMKMSKQDVKDEYKQMEGDPLVKAKIKEVQRRMAMSRMMQEVPNADVVIRNPTHFAVALRYDLEKDGAPILLAKGQDEQALRIIKIAEENNVVVIENVPLARAIYATTDVNREIPPEFYGTISEILVYVYKLKNKKLV